MTESLKSLKWNNKVTGSVARRYCQYVKQYQDITAKNKTLGM